MATENNIVGEYPYNQDEQNLVVKNFTFHPAKDNQVYRYELIRLRFRELAELLNTVCPPSRERSLSHTNLEQASFWANSSIARNETENK